MPDADVLTDQVERRIDLHRRFLLAGLSDPSAFAAIPWDVQLFLLPDDHSFVAHEIVSAARAAHRGADVYLRHVRLADLPD